MRVFIFIFTNANFFRAKLFRKPGRAVLFLMLACFVLPLGVAILAYQNFDRADSGGANHARLISPPVALVAFSQTDVDGNTLDLSALQKRWTLIHWLRGECDARCEEIFYNTRQVRAALHKNTHRVQRLILANDARELKKNRRRAPRRAARGYPRREPQTPTAIRVRRAREFAARRIIN